MNLTLKMSNLYDEEGFSQGKVLDMRDISGTNCYCSPAAADLVRARISGARSGTDIPGQGRIPIHWIDSGDYHYLTLFFLQMLDEPFELLLADKHPDCQNGAFDEGTLSCGNWVQEARRSLPMMQGDLWVDGQGKITESTRRGSRDGGELPLYISIDLDILDRRYFRTDWDQGLLSPSGLESILGQFSGRRILGVDICGGLTVAKGATGSDLTLNRSFREMLTGLLRTFHE